MLEIVRGPHFGWAEIRYGVNLARSQPFAPSLPNQKQREFAAVVSVDRDPRLLVGTTWDILYDATLLRTSLKRNFRKGAPRRAF